LGQIHGVYGKGNIQLSSTFGKIKTITDVLYVLDLKKNLLSVGMIADRRNIVMFDFDKCLVIQNENPNVVIAKGVRDSKNRLYRLKTQSIKTSVQTLKTFVTHAHLETSDANHHQTMFWHRRMVHLHYQALYTMSSWYTKIDEGNRILHRMHDW